MNIKYLGPSPEVNVGGFGSHRQDEVKDYPDDVGKELLETSVKQQFEEVKAPEQLNATETIKLVKEADAENLDELANGEDRKTVLAAIAARREELAGGE